MTKLIQWLSGLVSFFAIWIVLLTDVLPAVSLSPTSKEVVLFLPIYLLIAFACFSLAVIGYRVAMFNDCKQASEELRQQISEAKEDLKSKGFKFTSS